MFARLLLVHCFRFLVDAFNCTGLADEKATIVAQLWKSSLPAIKRAAVGNTLMVNELVDIEWRFGVTAANTDLNKVVFLFRRVLCSCVVIRESSNV